MARKTAAHNFAFSMVTFRLTSHPPLSRLKSVFRLLISPVRARPRWHPRRLSAIGRSAFFECVAFLMSFCVPSFFTDNVPMM